MWSFEKPYMNLLYNMLSGLQVPPSLVVFLLWSKASLSSEQHASSQVHSQDWQGGRCHQQQHGDLKLHKRGGCNNVWLTRLREQGSSD